MLKYLRFISVYLFFCFIFSSVCFAESYFSESFDNINNDNWFYYCNYDYSNQINRTSCSFPNSKVVYENGSINLLSNNADFPVIISKKYIIPSVGDFQVRIKFRYPSVTSRGVGLGIGFTGPYGKLFSQFGIWNDTSSGNNFKFYYNDFSASSTQGNCSNFSLSTDDLLGRSTVSNISLTNNYWHYFDVIKINNFYYVYLDSVYGLNNPIYTTEIKNNCVPKIIWFGNFISDSGGSWTTFSLDSIDVFTSSFDLTPTPTLITTSTPIPTLTPSPTPSPTLIPTVIPTPTLTPTAVPTLVPTPTPTSSIRKKKIFILPGLGASWNSDAIVYGKNVGDNVWKMTPFVNNYNGLIELLEKNDLKKDEDYFVWNYDWRRPLEEIKNKFDVFIKSKNLTNQDDIYLIGHSLGGVVARLWTQDNKNNANIKQVINLGSPNLGSLDTYSVWNGGEILEYNGVSSVAFQILLGLQNKGFAISDINKIRNFAPIAKDLLPTFDYVLKSNKNISWNKLSYFNDYLDNRNKLNDISERWFSFVGTGFSTPKTLKLGKRSAYDKVLSLWPDGEILSINKSDGDGTVLKESASFGTSNKTSLVSNHGEITNKSIDLIADKIGLEKKKIEFVYNDNFKDSLVVFIGSPAKAELKCGNEIYQEENGFIVVKNKNYQDCDLNLSPTDNGLVHIVSGNTKQNKWNYSEKEVKLGNNFILKVLFNDGSIFKDKRNKKILEDQIRDDLKTLGLSKAVKFFEKGDLSQVAIMIFEYRNKTKEQVISQRLLDNLFYLSIITNSNKYKSGYRLFDKYVDVIELTVDLKSKRSVLNKDSVKSFALLKDLQNKIDDNVANKIYPNYSIVAVLASGYGLEAIR